MDENVLLLDSLEARHLHRNVAIWLPSPDVVGTHSVAVVAAIAYYEYSNISIMVVLLHIEIAHNLRLHVQLQDLEAPEVFFKPLVIL